MHDTNDNKIHYGWG